MQSTITFILIASMVALVINIAAGIMWKKSVMALMAQLMAVTTILVSIIAFICGQYGLSHLFWGIPVGLITFFVSFAIFLK